MVLESGVRGVMVTRGTLQPRSLGDIGERETAAQVREMDASLFFYYQPFEIFDSMMSRHTTSYTLLYAGKRSLGAGKEEKDHRFVLHFFALSSSGALMKETMMPWGRVAFNM